MYKLAAIFILVFTFVGCTSQPVLHPEGVYVPTLRNGDVLPLEQVETAIMTAARKRGWVPGVVEPGLIEATLVVRSHRAVINIHYTRDSYDIAYQDSENLNYKRGKIHRNYNRWVANLDKSIQKELSIQAQK
jgi:hypothetical protein